MRALPRKVRERLIEAGRRLVCQEDARVLVQPRANEPGFWFGGGNICRDADGALLLCGRYRNGGDSRAGIEAGPRGAELAVFRSTDEGRTFAHIASLHKADVAPPGEVVLSIEGSCLVRSGRGLELYVSSEKLRDYPAAVREFQKPGTGVWSIDVLRAEDAGDLRSAEPEPVLRPAEPARLHAKDPVVFSAAGRTWMVYCAHPFNWTSSNNYIAERHPDGRFRDRGRMLLPRGPVWDVAVCRVTARLVLPRAGVLAELPPVSLYFYDGAECMHDHGRNGRPRGCSCEELGGLAVGVGEAPRRLTRLSVEAPLFVSPHGTGCSRYASVFEGEEAWIATWQQSQPDGSQPLVTNRVPKAEVARILADRS
jgi:hypothetical protein